MVIFSLEIGDVEALVVWCFLGLPHAKGSGILTGFPNHPGSQTTNLPLVDFVDANPSPPIKKNFIFFVKLKKGAIKSWNCFSIFKLGKVSFPDGETSRNTSPIIPSSGEKDLLGGLHTQGQRMAKHSITRPLILRWKKIRVTNGHMHRKREREREREWIQYFFGAKKLQCLQSSANVQWAKGRN